MIQAFDWSEPSAFGCTLAPCQVAEAKTTKRRAVGPGRRILWRSGIKESMARSPRKTPFRAAESAADGSDHRAARRGSRRGARGLRSFAERWSLNGKASKQQRTNGDHDRTRSNRSK